MKCPDFLFWTVSKYLVGCNTICPDESHGLASKSIMTKKTPNNELGVSLVKTEITGRPASNYPNVVSETKLNLWPDSVGQDQLARPGKVWSLGRIPTILPPPHAWPGQIPVGGRAYIYKWEISECPLTSSHGTHGTVPVCWSHSDSVVREL